jgi:hypothetical protein
MTEVRSQKGRLRHRITAREKATPRKALVRRLPHII